MLSYTVFCCFTVSYICYFSLQENMDLSEPEECKFESLECQKSFSLPFFIASDCFISY
jgi:hypothetical protein